MMRKRLVALWLIGGSLALQVPAMSAQAQFLPPKGDISTAQKRGLDAGGSQRTYWVQIPGGAKAPMPIVLLLHGGTETAEDVWRQTSLPTIGARDGFIVAAPQGIDKHWNDGRGSTIAGDVASTADDVGFLRAVITELVLRDGGDARAVFVIGASNGGFMSMYYACHAADTLRAGANVISTLPESLLGACKTGKPLPWLSMNGVRDPIVPFNGQRAGTMIKGRSQPGLLSADATFAFWADRAGCAPAITTQRIGASVEKRVRSCANGTRSEQYVFFDAGHVWPGFPINRPLIARLLGGTNLDVDTGEAAWSFFRSTLPAR